MRKVTALLLGAAFVVAAISGTARAKPAGIGLEWGMGPVIQFGDFDMKFEDGFTLSWEVSDVFTVGVFRADGDYRGEQSYTNELGAGIGLAETLTVNGTTALSGIRLLAQMPGLSFLEAGIELGVMQFSPAAYNVVFASGAPGALADFGAPAFAGASNEMLGLAAQATVLKAETKTVSTEVNISAALRFVNMYDAAILGTQEVNKVSTAKIDPVGSYNNLAVAIGLSMVF